MRAACSGWENEYVEGSRPELLEMLREGRIELVAEVSWTEEGDTRMLFSSRPMGGEEYHACTARDNAEIKPADRTTYNGECCTGGELPIGAIRKKRDSMGKKGAGFTSLEDRALLGAMLGE